MEEIYELDEKNKICGELYIIKSNIDNKPYVGQTLSHRKNKGKYRPFGYIGRFNDHISEAINNTKRKQCTYLNNAIRKYGKDSFTVELITKCKIEELDELERKYIIEYNSYFPNGYNLTQGGKTVEHIKIANNEAIQEFKKRGRDFGYKHKDETRNKMSERLKKICSSDTIKTRMKDVMTDYYDKKKIDTLSALDLDDDIEKYIKPVKKKETGEIYDYKIRINKKEYGLFTDKTPQEKHDYLKNILIKAKENQQVKIVEIDQKDK